MADSLKCSVYFLTLCQVGYEELNTAVAFYHDRSHFESKKRNQYAQFAEEFSLQQGRQFVLHNRVVATPSKMSRLKDQVKELDDILASPTNNVCKLIWLTSSRILIGFDNALFAWLSVDPVSGDLMRVCVDSSVRDLKQLSGRRISDFKIVRLNRTLIVLAYADSNRVDFVGFNRSSQFDEYLNIGNKKDAKDAVLEKLAVFEPVLLKTVELQCPSAFDVHKMILLNSSKHSASSITVWWSNYSDSSSSVGEGPQQQSLSLLERDDLHTNVISLSTNFDDQHNANRNLIESASKSEGCLLGLVCAIDDTGLVAVEQFENHGQFSIGIYKHSSEIGGGGETRSKLRPKQKLISFELPSRVISCDQVRASTRFISILTIDQTLIIYDINRNFVTRKKVDIDKFTSIEWLIDDLLFGLYNQHGVVAIFDVALNRLDISYLTRFEHTFKSIGEYVNEKLTHNNKLRLLACSRLNSFDSVWSLFAYERGPLGLYRLRVPANFNCIALTTHYLKSSQIDSMLDRYLNAAVGLMAQLDWDLDGYAALSCFYRLMNFLLNMQPSNDEEKSKQEHRCQSVLSTFYNPSTCTSSLQPTTIRAFRHAVSRYARRFFFLLVAHGSLERAYRLAIDLNSSDLFVDLYHCALERDALALAHLCADRARHIGARRVVHDVVQQQQQHSDELALDRIDFDEVSESDDDEINANAQEMTTKTRQTHEIAPAKLKVYAEQNVEDYAQKVISENIFLYNLKFDSF